MAVEFTEVGCQVSPRWLAGATLPSTYRRTIKGHREKSCPCSQHWAAEVQAGLEGLEGSEG